MKRWRCQAAQGAHLVVEVPARRGKAAWMRGERLVGAVDPALG
jgi:hypothetical protein